MKFISFLAAIAGLVLPVLGVGIPTAQTAIVGSFAKGPVDFAIQVDPVEFDSLFGSTSQGIYPAETQVRQFFRNGGASVFIVRIDPLKPLAEALAGSILPPQPSGLGALLPLSDLGLLVCPELTSLSAPEITTCFQRIAGLGEKCPLFTLLDPPASVTTAAEMITWRQAHLSNDLAHVAVYFPKLSVDPATWSGGSSATRITTGASGTMAAVIANNDSTRGIWKPPAGPSTTFLAEGLSVDLTTTELGDLNVAGVNALRNLAGSGLMAWGSRTLDSDPENIYVSVVRSRRWIVRSLERELSDAALQANNMTLWSSLRSRAETFLLGLYNQGAFAGISTNEAYFVRCDSSTTTNADVLAHRVHVLLGCAYLSPAEFIVDTVTLSTLDIAKPVPDLPVLVSPPVNDVIQVTYPTTPGFNHSFQSSGTLATGSWFDGSALPGDGTWSRLEIPTSDPRRFFRVKTVTAW